MRNTRKVMLLASLTSLALLGLATAAGAQTYPPGGCGLATSSSTVSAGGTVTVATTGGCSGTGGFAPGSTVTITFASTPVTIGTTTADASGAISTTVTIPADAASGQHTITASGPAASGGTLSISATVVVPGPGGATALAFTGSSSSGPALWIGAGALVGGLALVVASRRRRSRVHS